MTAQIRISVRALVEFIMRHGDIDNRRKASSGPEVMLEGANIHRMIQRRQGKSYHAEVYLQCVIKRPDSEIVVDGRADGIIVPEADAGNISSFIQNEKKCIAETTIDDENSSTALLCDTAEVDAADLKGHVIIDEIKTTYRELEYIKCPEPEHLAQAKCYAYIFSDVTGLTDIGVRITYCNKETHEIRYFDSLYTKDELAVWFSSLMKAYIRFADFETGWKKIRNMSIDCMEFPYEYRAGQKKLLAQVYNSIADSENLFVMAPTGVGKTIATVYPSLKSLAEDKAETIFYLTAKTITRTVASDCLTLLRGSDDNGLRLKSVVITAKEKICPLEKCKCDPESCPYAKGHFDRINDAMYDLLINEDEFSREKIEEYAGKHMVCPFEYCLDMSLFSDMIICDYNYVFDPNVYLRRFFGETSTKEFIFLIDEAHNLAERAMRMYSADLVKEELLAMKKLVKEADPYLSRSFESCNRYMLEKKRECDEYMVTYDLTHFVALLLKLCARIEQFLDEKEHFADSDELLEVYFRLRHFLNIYENMNEKDYVQYFMHTSNGEFEVHLMCANPAKSVRACTDRARSAVFFSATLLPLEYYRMMLGARESDPAVYASSVFDPKKRALIVARDVTSRYKMRSEGMYDLMAQYIASITAQKAGNYMVFFPSFAFLERVYEMFSDRYHDPGSLEVIVQSQSMSEAEREDFLSRFSSRLGRTLPENAGDPGAQTLVGFCVLGGIFSEGIDLKNDALIGAVIVGCGLPMVCTERELMRRCYEEMGLDGFAYAYRYPGMNKVLQAAGRVIRTEEDRGVVALLDDRFLTRDYISLFPREWKEYSICCVDDVEENLERFWDFC